MQMNKKFVLIGIVIALIIIVVMLFGPAPSTPSPTPTPTLVPNPTLTPLPPPILVPTPTPLPLPTLVPTPTPTPTPTPVISIPLPVKPVIEFYGGYFYTIQRGDNLWNIAGEHYENPLLWPIIYKANKYLTNPDLIHSGNLLWLPSKVKK